MPSVALAEEAFAVAIGAGEGAADVAEELALEEVLGDGAAVDAREGLLGAGTGVVEGAGDDLFAGAALAEDQHRDVGVLTRSMRA